MITNGEKKKLSLILDALSDANDALKRVNLNLGNEDNQTVLTRKLDMAASLGYAILNGYGDDPEDEKLYEDMKKKKRGY